MLSSTTETRDEHPPDLPMESMVAALTRRATLDRPAYTHIDYLNRTGEAHTLTWAELYGRMLAVARRIRQSAAPGDRVAILCPQNLSYPIAFFGALAADTIAVPLFAPEMSSHGDRLVGALADCEPTVWLTAESALGPVQTLLADPRVPQPRDVIAVDSLASAGAAEIEPPPAVDLDAPAYLQYTSGSTGNPAGAVITHRAITINMLQATAAFELTDEITMVGWIPLFHDMGLMMMVCTPAVLGAQSVFSAPFDFVRRPKRWLEQLSGRPNALTAAPNFAYEYAIDRLTAEERAALDLSGVRIAINGAEPIKPSTIERFQELFGPCGFAAEAHRPSYGLAEATVFVSTSPAGTAPLITSLDRAELTAGRATAASDGDADAVRLVSAGVPGGQHVCIVDHVECTLLPDGEVGEVWIHGGNVAAGYWGQPERSRETFDGRLLGGNGLPPAGWLRTGDLGVRHAGELYITGRLKDVIIVDGKNHYPHDIEATVAEAHPAVVPGRVAAFGLASEAGETVVVALECVRGADADAGEITTAVRRAVSAVHDLKLRDVQILHGSKVLRTSSGKIARAANRDRYLAERGP